MCFLKTSVKFSLTKRYEQPFYFNRLGEIVSKKSDQEKICIQAKSHKEAQNLFKISEQNFDYIWLQQNEKAV